MSAVPNFSAAHRLAQTLLLERAKTEAALMAIYEATGDFEACVTASNGALQSVANQVRERGGKLGGGAIGGGRVA